MRVRVSVGLAACTAASRGAAAASPLTRAQGTCRAGVGSEGVLEPAASACAAAAEGPALEGWGWG